ncbi:LLM class flavin-dependent oxidoreductase [Corynebacterium callunae]|uniref:LLM class flavin-dependent oxidoreductase n=1 Tax=Corynebacterium callunae TaxID=1721 RepID=UPI003981E8B9
MTGISRAGINSPGSYPANNPYQGLNDTLDLYRIAEEIGYQTAGIRQRHLEWGSSSALTFLAAATQRTTKINLETNVVPLGYENPFRLAEDFSTVAALSQGRLAVGISTSVPHQELLAPLNRTDVSPLTDSYGLIKRFLEALRGNPLSDELIPTPYGTVHTPSINPHIPDLINNVWLGAGSDRSTTWAAQHGLSIYLGNITNAVDDLSFEEAQRARLDLYYQEFKGENAPRVAVERVILPLDSASAEQTKHYQEFAAARSARTAHRHGERRSLIQPDLIGSSDEIIEQLKNDSVFDGRTELRVGLPYAFDREEYIQIIRDIAELVLPAFGWNPDAASPSDLPPHDNSKELLG